MSMVEVRVGVDALDRALVMLLAERQRYMDAAARIKTDRAMVRDEARIEHVVTKVKATARTAGLSEAIAEPVWRMLVDRCIAHEFESGTASVTGDERSAQRLQRHFMSIGGDVGHGEVEGVLKPSEQSLTIGRRLASRRFRLSAHPGEVVCADTQR